MVFLVMLFAGTNRPLLRQPVC